ncbi:NAD(P)-binding domain-containing protein [Streptomyces sp. WMMC1477]|uniref:NAD(P)-binding domain-containing protein n=1 Tax=Streptomyces sp. WMMC1477 TaxID=3015155 RepID=UPI0022B6FD36|nr:NAD(P)-binding domain-containing protein [Streptomyces sp. WMMC1477]MCZ7431119.1 NAD(P)-binding domain-containing protein [Streptomyces sp. WMMC1477]
MSDRHSSKKTVAVIGAGPVGLAAAAHLLERGLEPVVLEAGVQAADVVQEWGHIRLFSPWRYNIDAAARRLLQQTEWKEPDTDVLPTGAELVENYLHPLAGTPQLAPRIHTDRRVRAVTRTGMDKVRSLGREEQSFLLRTTSSTGEVHDFTADAVIDASGVWGQPNPLGTAGLRAPGEEAVGPYLTGALPDVLGRGRARFAGRHTLVAGMGHSAANTLLALAELADTAEGTTITWVVRGASPTRLYGGGDADGLPARGALGSRLKERVERGDITLIPEFTITGFEVPAACCGSPSGPLSVRGQTPKGAMKIDVDNVVDAVGFRPDLEMLREIRLGLDPAVEAPVAIGPMIDPNAHSCGTVPPHGERELAHPEPDFYIAGVKSYGRAPTFLLATGYEQVRSVAAALAGDRAAADAVELELPETGVCTTDLPSADGATDEGAGCCAPGPAPAQQGFPTGFEHGYAGDAARNEAQSEASCCAPEQDSEPGK